MRLSLAAYSLGLLLLAAATVPVAWTAWRAARAFVRDGRPLLRLSVAGVVGVCEVIAAVQLAGVAGLLSRFPLVLAGWVAAAAVFVIARTYARRPVGPAGQATATTLDAALDEPMYEPPAPTVPTRNGRDWLRIAFLALVVFAVATAFVSALLKPSFASDTANYHLPDVANWVRDHSIMHVRQFQLSVFQNTYPMDAEAVAAWFVIPFGRDFLVNLAPLLQAALVVVAVGALGEELGLTTFDAVLIGFTALFLPVVGTSNIGSLGSDLLPFAGYVLCVVFILRWRRSERALDVVFGGLALGLAFGAKFTGLAMALPFAATFCLLCLWRRRWAQGLVLLPLCILAPAVVWLARNVAAVGNPVWPWGVFGLPFGWLRATGDDVSIVKYVARTGVAAAGKVLFDYVVGAITAVPFIVAGLPGLWRSVKGDRTRAWLLLGLPVVATLVLWAMPFTAAADGYNVPATVRYVAACIAIVLVGAVAALLPGKHAGAWRWGLLTAAAAGVAVCYLSPVLPIYAMATKGTAVGVLAAGAYLAWALLVAPPVRWRPRPLVAAVTIGLLAAGAAVAARPVWAAGWYRNVYETGLADVFRTVRDRPVSGKRIAVAGIEATYPLYGPRLDNEVIYVGRDAAVHAWGPGDRALWLDALRRRCVDYLAVFDDPEQWLSPVQEVDFVASHEGLQPLMEERVPFTTGRHGYTAPDGRRLVGLYAVTGLPASCRAR